MALLRNRVVNLLGPNGAAEVSPIYTVQYPDGTREDVPLKVIQMSESEQKEFAKANKQHADIPKVIDDKEHQDIVDSQDPKKIRDRQKKDKTGPADQPVQVPTFVRPVDVQNAAPLVNTQAH
jgi:hypothetical protein